MDYEPIITLGISFGIGILVGLQRESTKNGMAGVRTFTFITLLGTLSGFLSEAYENPYIIPTMGFGIVILMVISNLGKIQSKEVKSIGITTEIAALMVFSIGAYLVVGERVVGIMVGGILAVMLYAKERLHDFIDKLKDKEISAIMTFVGITLIILPILPDENFGPMEVLNPRNIWMMVALIVGMSVFGYFVYKWMGNKSGLVTSGILGGIISSTATTVSFSRKTKAGSGGGKLAAFVILLAVTISLVRVAIEIMVVVKNKSWEVILPIAVLFVFMILLCVVFFFLIIKDKNEEELPEPKNPAQFKSALIFAGIYAAIMVFVAFTEKEFGNEGLYVASAIGGLANKDAITLSLSGRIRSGLDINLGWRLIMTAIISNMIFKVLIASVIGKARLAKWLGLFIMISVAFSVLLIWLWPDNIALLI
ncbi:MgtC/SapB family protein [Moheibacter lacus]|uniref:MgtC/SapB family protein n=1 Tax=Moheibacter lacus TaxID=2745851 RepID=A0A838ZSA2_9FLAO|nr:MgtC/SapB family protein [Moheibacter lacus]MBA5629913.1 MgtC/SapB family protein [Moheibacter lacus]